MSLATHFAGAIEHAQFHELHALSSKLWKAYAAGHVGEAEVAALSEAIESRKPKHGAEPASFAPPKAPAKPQRSPDKQASIERRRRLARASPVPPELVHEFTQGEHAVMTVMGGEMQRTGIFDWPHAKTAAIAGTCRTVVKTALRKARNFALLFSRERRYRGEKSKPNIVRVLSQRWGNWLKWVGGRKKLTTSYQVSKPANFGPVETPECGLLASAALRSGP
jgi:hypothetical protein